MTDILRLIVAILALFVAGSSAVTAVRYIWSAWKLGRAPGRILARHVAEVSAGTTGLVVGYASAIGEQLGARVSIPADARLWIYLVSMVLLLIGLVEVGTYQRVRARSYPQRQEQVRRAVRVAMEGQAVRGPHSADRVSVLATNAVLGLEGTPPLPEPGPTAAEPPPSTDTTSATGYGRHALRKDRRLPR